MRTFGTILGAAFLLTAMSGAAGAACPEIPPVARTPQTGSPFATDNKGVTKLDTQTSDNVRITGGCIDPPVVGLTTIYAKRYGAKADRVNVASGGAISSGTTALAVPGAAFASTDVGKIIIVAGAGASGNALLTTIAAYVDPTHVTLTVAASTTVTSAAVEYATNDVASIGAAVTAAAALPNGARVLLPAGNYVINPAIARVILASNVTLDGEGAVNIRCASVADTATAGSNSCIYGSGLSNVRVQFLTIKGMVDVTPTLSPKTLDAPIYITGSTNVDVTRVGVSYSRGYGISLFNSTNVSASFNTISYTMSDGIAFGNSSIISAAYNIIDHTSDNAISVSTADGSVPANARTVALIGNVITESIGMSVSGGHGVTITGNTGYRMLGPGLLLLPFTSFGVGDTPAVANNVTGNVWLDNINPAPGQPLVVNYDACMVIGGGQRQAGTELAVPGYPDPATGNIVDLYGTTTGRFWQGGTNDSSIPSPGGSGWNISGNTCMRTLPAVTAYSDWGYGAGMWVGAKLAGDGITNRGTPYTGAIAEADLQTSCIVIDGPLRNSSIHNNYCNTTGDYGIFFKPTGPRNGDYDGLKITNNTFYDYNVAGVSFAATGVRSSKIILDGNSYDADPRFRSANRGANGTWAANTEPYGISSAFMSGLTIHNEKFRNLANPIIIGGSANVHVGPSNTIYGIPGGNAFSTSNVGVGAIDNQTGVKGLFQYVYEDDNPASASYGQQLAPSGTMFASMPAAGCFLRGTMVWKIAPAVASGQTLIGWSRLTSGCAHVDGTDWQAVYTNTGAASATSQASPTNPTGTTDLTGKMMGLAGSVTPTATGRAYIAVSGDIFNSNAVGNGAKPIIKYGTGSAPANGDANAGTACGTKPVYIASTTGGKVPFSLQCIVTGLTLSTAYWIDVNLAAEVAGTATIENVSVTAFEIR